MYQYYNIVDIARFRYSRIYLKIINYNSYLCGKRKLF